MRVQSGEIEDPTFFFRWWGAPDGADYRDPAVWAAANPAYGDYLNPEDFESAVKSISEMEYRTKRMNQWVTTNTAWLPQGAWDRLAVERTLEKGEDVVVSFDGAFSNDSTAITACTLDGFIQTLAIWERPLDDPHWQVPMDEVEAKMYDICKTYQVREIAADPYRWASVLQKWENDGLPVVMYSQSPARMVPACAGFADAVAQEKLSHNGDPVLARHLDNCTVKIDRFGPRVVKEHKGSPRKIDAAVCAIMSWDRAKYHSQHVVKKPTAEFISL
jgi:phage terminase large subunit-like protein